MLQYAKSCSVHKALHKQKLLYLFKGVVKLLAVVNKLPLFALKLLFNLLQLTFKLFLAKTKRKQETKTN